MKSTLLTRILILICIIASLSGLSGCSNEPNGSLNVDKDGNNYKEMYVKLLSVQPPEILDIQFEAMDGKTLKELGNWVELESVVKIRVILDKPSTLVELYITPTGTQTYKLQQLIDIIMTPNKVVECTWIVPEGTMGHLWMVAYNRHVGRKSDTVNVIREN